MAPMENPANPFAGEVIQTLGQRAVQHGPFALRGMGKEGFRLRCGYFHFSCTTISPLKNVAVVAEDWMQWIMQVLLNKRIPGSLIFRIAMT